MKSILLSRISVLVFLLSIPGSFAFADTKEWITADSPVLCPKADHHKSINMNGRSVSIPKILEEEELLAGLNSGDEQESRTAAVSLALGGNLKAFSTLLEKRDLNLLRIYGWNYQNRNGTRCVDTFIENRVLELFDDPELRETLLSFFGKNLYRSRELFEKIVSLELDLKEIRFYTSVIRALVATNQPGFEEEVLQHAIRYTSNVEVKYWHNFMPIDKYYLDFFIQRNYKPAVSYMQGILNETHYSTVSGVHKTHVYNRHRSLYYQLDRFPSYLVEKIFAEQVSKLKDITRDEVFFTIELEYAVRYALKHALSFQGRMNIVQYLATILTTEQTSTPSASKKALALIDYKMRSHAIEFLAQAGTRSSVPVLIAELNRQIDRADGRSSASLAARILTSLSALPASIEIDIPEFMKAVYRLDKRTQLLTVSHILGKHPHPEGHAFLLSQLEDIALSGENFRMQYGVESKSTFKTIFAILITFDAADYLFLSRQKIDTLLDEGALDEKSYIAYSKQLNALIGNESALYAALSNKTAGRNL